MNPLETYFKELIEIRSTGAATPETAYYPALSNLLNEVGKALNPKVKCIMGLKDWGAGLPDGWTRATFIVREANLEQLKALAYYHRRPLKDILEEALGRYLKKAGTGEALEVYRNQKFAQRNGP